MERIIALVNEIERDIRNTMDQEISSQEIGNLVMEKLKDFDDVAISALHRFTGSLRTYRVSLKNFVTCRPARSRRDLMTKGRPNEDGWRED